MPMAVTCDDCGKVYSVSPAMAGKRVKCKACGAVFTITNPTVGESLLAAPSVSRAAIFDRTFGILSWFQPDGWAVLVCLMIAIPVGLIGQRMQTVWVGTLIGLPIAAVVLGAIGLTVLMMEGLTTPGFFRFPSRDAWKFAWPLIVGFLVGVVGIAVVILVIRFLRPGAFESGPFYDRLARLLLRVFAIALMPLLLSFISYSTGAFVKPEPSPLEKQVAAMKDPHYANPVSRIIPSGPPVWARPPIHR